MDCRDFLHEIWEGPIDFPLKLGRFARRASTIHGTKNVS